MSSKLFCTSSLPGVTINVMKKNVSRFQFHCNKSVLSEMLHHLRFHKSTVAFLRRKIVAVEAEFDRNVYKLSKYAACLADELDRYFHDFLFSL